MELREALETAARILKTGERVELQPTKDGAEVYVLKRRRGKLNQEPAPKRGDGGAERG